MSDRNIPNDQRFGVFEKSTPTCPNCGYEGNRPIDGELICTTCGYPLDDHSGMGLPCPYSKPPMSSKKLAYPAWYDEPCPHCKNGRLKGECDVTLRQEIERLRGELEVTRQCLFQAEAAKVLASETPGFTKRLRDARLNWAKSCSCMCEACDDLYEEIKDICASEKATAECTRSHPHELMSPECELRTEIARLTDQLARWESPDNWGAFVELLGLPRDHINKPLGVAAGIALLNSKLDRYMKALQTANGYLIMNGLEPVKLEYPSEKST